MEIINKDQVRKAGIKAVVFDFDGTLSTLRHGWEYIMKPLMVEMIAGGTEPDNTLITEVEEYIDQSTGIQTYYQMQWLAETVKRYGRNNRASMDPWWYKAEYNRRLMKQVKMRIASIQSGKHKQSDFLIEGSETFLKVLHDKGLGIYVASGTDHPDVTHEAEVLGLKKYFKGIYGAPVDKAECSKEAVLRMLIEENMIRGDELAVIGDGKVEIALGREVGATTLGIASDEHKRTGVNVNKRKRLIKAGAHAIVGDFGRLNEILAWLNIK